MGKEIYSPKNLSFQSTVNSQQSTVNRQPSTVTIVKKDV